MICREVRLSVRMVGAFNITAVRIPPNSARTMVSSLLVSRGWIPIFTSFVGVNYFLFESWSVSTFIVYHKSLVGRNETDGCSYI